jgi:SAM-dependent methyltransferase
VDFREHIRDLARGKKSILEIGPSHNPIVSKRDNYPVVILDHASREDLVKKYAPLGVDASHLDLIEEVDYVTTDISSLKPSGVSFDLIVASHVVEHTTDLIAFFNSCSDLLTSDGQIALLVPDKRFCFDTFRPLTSPGELIDASLVNRDRHHGAVFDHYSYFCVNGEKAAWSVSEPFVPRLQHSEAETMTAFAKATTGDEYFDCHSWVFTPSSFQFVVSELRSGGFIELGVHDIHPTQGFEFFSVLSKSAAKPTISKLDLLRAIDAETGSGDHSELEYLRGQLALTTAELESLHASNSWRLTRPLRQLRTRLKR